MEKRGLRNMAWGMTVTAAVCLLTAAVTYGASAKRAAYEKSPEGRSGNVQAEKRTRTEARGSAAGVKDARGKRLPRTIDLSGLKPETPFIEAIDILRHCTEPPLNIVVFWGDVEKNGGIDRNTAIGMEAVSGVTLGEELELILMSVSAGASRQLGYVVKKGIIVVGTTEYIGKRMVTRVYDVTDLSGAPAGYYSPGGFNGWAAGPYGGPYGGNGGAYGIPYGGPYDSGGSYSTGYGPYGSAGGYGSRRPYSGSDELVNVIEGVSRPGRVVP